MRAILIVGMMAVAGAAWGQQTNWKAMNAAGAVGAATASAAWCSFKVNSPATEKYLAEAGFDRANAGDISGLELAFAAERQKWANAGQSASIDSAGKATLVNLCQQIIDAYGPEGAVRKGLISKK